MEVGAVLDMGTVRSLQQILSSLRASLPLGCAAAIEPHEDDACKWVVTLQYAGSAGGGGEHDVEVLLSFAAPNVPPTVSVQRPRLVAPFLYYGALCSVDLMSTTWQLTKESVTSLLMAVHRSLDMGDPHSGVTLEEVGRGAHYSAEEGTRGQALLRKLHADEFRALDSAAAATASATAAALEFPPPVELEDESALAAHLQEALGPRVSVRTDAGCVVVTASDDSFVLPPLHVVGPVDKGRRLSVRFDVPCAVIPADSAVCLRNVRLTVWHCVVSGMLRLAHSEVVAEQVVVAGRGAFFTEDCAVRGSADDTLLVAQHRATATVRRSSLRCPQSGKEGSRSVPFLLTLNCSVLTLEDCVVEASCRDVGLRALVESSVSLQRCVIRAGSSAVRSIGGAVSGVESTFTGGIVGEQQSIVELRSCTVDGATHGLTVTGSSRLALEQCTASGTTAVGCLVDGAGATIRGSLLTGTEASLRVVNKSKCIASQLLVQPVEGTTLMHGVEVRDGATLVIKDSDIRNVHAIGMLVLRNGSLDAEDLRIDGCTKPPGDISSGVQLENSGVCSVRRTTVRGYFYGIVGVGCGSGALTIEDCACDESYVGYQLDGCSDVSVVRCRARSSGAGLYALNKSKCIATQLVVEPVEGKTLMHGVKVGDGATLVIKDSDIRNGEEVPMFVENGGVVEEDELRIDGCAKREVL